MARQARPLRTDQLSALGAALRAVRKQKGLRQKALAKRTGGLERHISAIENGTIDPSAATLIALAAALGAEWLLIPRAEAAPARRLAGLSGTPGTPSGTGDESMCRSRMRKVMPASEPAKPAPG
jgi:transcriptional regulator with XRE-family HTH domain